MPGEGEHCHGTTSAFSRCCFGPHKGHIIPLRCNRRAGCRLLLPFQRITQGCTSLPCGHLLTPPEGSLYDRHGELLFPSSPCYWLLYPCAIRLSSAKRKSINASFSFSVFQVTANHSNPFSTLCKRSVRSATHACLFFSFKHNRICFLSVFA